MSPFPRLVRTARVALVLIAALVGFVTPAAAASKITIALLGDAAPGGGVFAGPGFTGWPAAAGEGWVAFRGEVSGGTTTEAMVVAHLTAPTSRTQVASIGETAPGGGKFRQFIGRPAVNAFGEVAFLASLTRDDDTATRGPAPRGACFSSAARALRFGRTAPGSARHRRPVRARPGRRSHRGPSGRPR